MSLGSGWGDICGGIPACKGAYILVLEVEEPREIRVGSLGRIVFRTGYYAYVGSARGSGGVRGRLCRHIRGSGRTRWHIDYLRRHARVAYYLYTCKGPGEGKVAERCLELLEPGPHGFGTSDDPANPTHLFACPKSLEECIERVQRCLEEAAESSHREG